MRSVISSSPRADGFSSAATLDDVGGVEVEPGHGVVALGLGRLLLQRERPAVLVELHDAVRRRVGHPVAEDRRAVDVVEAAQPGAEPAAVEDVVAEHQPDRLVAHVVGADDEGLREPVGARLHGVGDRDAELRAVAEQPLELLRTRAAW